VSDILVLVHRSIHPGSLPAGSLFVPFETVVDAVVALKATTLPAVVCTDGLAPEDLPALAAAIAAHPASCIEVRSAAWDGEATSPVSAACRGVISGFGPHGLRRAVELLLSGR
jgi:3-dehydroquinate dehydratase